MAQNVLELRIESSLDAAGFDAAKQGVAELNASTSAASTAVSGTGNAATEVLRDTGEEASRAAQEVTRVGESANRAAAGVNTLGSATDAAASATSRLSGVNRTMQGVQSSANAAGAAMAGIGTAAAGAQESAVAGLNVMSLGANLLTGNVMGTIQATTELAGHFKGISMLKFSGIALAIAGVATAWQFVTKKIKEFNAEIGKARVDALAHQMDQLKVRYDEVTKSIERFNAARSQKASNEDRFADLSFGQARLNLAAKTEGKLGSALTDGEREDAVRYSEMRGQDIDNAQKLYNAKKAAARASQEVETTEKQYQAAVRATNSEIRALNNLYSELNQMQKQAKTGSMGQKAEAEAAIPGLEAQIEKTKQATAEGRARAETLRLAKEQAPVEAQIAEQTLKAVEAEVKLTNAARERKMISDFQARRDAERVALASSVADAEEEVARARERLNQAENNRAIRERTRELQKQANKMQDQVNKAKELLGLLGKKPDREKALRDHDRQAERDRKDHERQQRRERQTAEAIARHANGKLAIDIQSGDYKVVDMDGDDITGRLSRRDRERLERLNRIRKAEEALDPGGQQEGIRNALKQQQEDAANNFGQGEVEAASTDLKEAEKTLEEANDAIRAFDEATQTGLQAVQEEVAQWRESAAQAITQAGTMNAQAVQQLTSETRAHNYTLTQLLTSI